MRNLRRIIKISIEDSKVMTIIIIILKQIPKPPQKNTPETIETKLLMVNKLIKNTFWFHVTKVSSWFCKV